MKDETYKLFSDCVHCGLCLSACPTYQELGTEMDSPRGRIYLMRALADGRIEPKDETMRHLDLCLGCRACETACPSGVQYGRLLEASRADLESERSYDLVTTGLKRVLVEQIFPHPDRLRAAMALGGLSRWATAFMPPALRTALQMMPSDVPTSPPLPAVTLAQGQRKYRVGFLAGCAGSVLFPHVNAATLLVLARNGCEVVVPTGQGCCGALHVHNGAMDQAAGYAQRNVEAFARQGPFDAIITNAAGCGSTLKEYHHLGAGFESFSHSVRDIHEWLSTIGIATPGPLNLRVTYQDACHLAHAQKIRQPPRQVLAAIPELHLTELAESDNCCGGAGIYNMLQPEMSDRLLKRKVDAVLETRAEVLAAGNPGCLMQIERGLRQRGSKIRCAHPIELLAEAYLASG